MPTLAPETSFLLAIDFQARLIAAMDGGGNAVANLRRLLDAAALFEVPALFTEQNPEGLGPSVADLTDGYPVAHKMTFDALQAPGILDRIPADRAVVVTGCEAHICVLQTVLSLLEAGRRVYVARDAVGSRRVDNKEAGLHRMERHGAEIVTTEMVVFEWLGTAGHPRFREAIRLIK